jgi:predicted nucleic acid-binding protein
MRELSEAALRMIAVDTNILVYSHREDSTSHSPARKEIKELAKSGKLWAIPWPAVHEFLALVTHLRIYSSPTPLEIALRQVRTWLDCPTFIPIGENNSAYFQYLSHVLESSQASRLIRTCLTIQRLPDLWMQSLLPAPQRLLPSWGSGQQRFSILICVLLVMTLPVPVSGENTGEVSRRIQPVRPLPMGIQKIIARI